MDTIILTEEDAEQLNYHYNGYTIDDSKGPHLIDQGADAKCITELLPSGRTAYLFYDMANDHVYVYNIS
jgi:hypothetical protein